MSLSQLIFWVNHFTVPSHVFSSFSSLKKILQDWHKSNSKQPRIAGSSIKRSTSWSWTVCVRPDRSGSTDWQAPGPLGRPHHHHHHHHLLLLVSFYAHRPSLFPPRHPQLPHLTCLLPHTHTSQPPPFSPPLSFSSTTSKSHFFSSFSLLCPHQPTSSSV